MHPTRSMTREIGTALAVLAIYLLTVLAPLHQARASQLAFEELGYAALDGGWVLCTAGGITGEDGEVSVAKCPATGIGKHEILPLALPAPAYDGAALNVAERPTRAALAPLAATPPTGSRGPPALV